jgi:xylose isomerase
MKRELDQLGRFLALVAEHKHKLGFKGTLLLEPKPKEPTKHQYDYDTATVYAFLQRYGLEQEYKVNIEANHAILSGHSFQHEVAYAYANGVFGSLDINRGDDLLGWDTDQFPNDVAQLALVLATFLEHGGFTTGGMNFDAKLRRQSIDPQDLFHAHIGGMDVLARALLVAEKIVSDGKLGQAVQERYAGWRTELGEGIASGKLSLADLSELVLRQGIDPKPRSGRQEALENLVNRYT